jgi:hypothetical protein
MKQYIDFIVTKIAIGACVGLPFIIIVNQFYNSIFLDWIQIILLFYTFIFLGVKLYIFNQALSGIRTGKNMPKPYSEHSVYQTNISEYESVAEKVRDFIRAVIKEDLVSLKITAEEMNCIRLRGVTPEKFDSFGLPEHYKISEDKIIISSLVFYPFSSDIFVPFINEISFTLIEDELKEVNDTIGPSLGLKKSEVVSSVSPLSNSVLLERLFSGSDSISFDEHSIPSIINSVKHVEIKDNQLILSNCD